MEPDQLASKDVALILQRTGELAGVRRPKGLGRWMQRNFDTIYEGFEQAPPDWDAFAIALSEAGITAPDGSPLRPDTARRAWARTLKKVAQVRAKKPELPTQPAPKVRPVIQQATPAPATRGPVPASDDEPDPTFEFRLLRPPQKTGE